MKAYILILLVLIFVTGCTVGHDSDSEIDRITLTRATEDCSGDLTVNIPVWVFEDAIVEQIKWRCYPEGVTDTLYLTVYHVYTYQPLHGWYVLENPLERLAYLKSTIK